jgi:hypothetical protein
MCETKSLTVSNLQTSTNEKPVSPNTKTRTRTKTLKRSFATGEKNQKADGEENHVTVKLSNSRNIITNNAPSPPTSPTTLEGSIKLSSNQQ